MFQNIINNLYTPKTSIFVHNTLTVYVILYYSVVVHDILNNVEETCNSKISDKVLGYYFLIFESLFFLLDLKIYNQISILIHIITCIFVVISLVIIKKNKVSRKN